jgi:hypothetical protein
MNNQKKRSSLVANIGIFFGVLILMFGVAELVVRILYKDTTLMFPRYHTDAVYGDYTLRTIRPDSNFFHTSIDGRWEFTTNGQGFRNYEDFQYKKPEGVIRVIALGDSHTQGFEVHQDYTYSSIIEKYLNGKGINAEVINAGVSGFSNAEELLLLENELVRYEPDYVVLGFFANDFQDNLKSTLFMLDSENNLVKTDRNKHIPGVRIQNLIYSIPGIQWLSENSYFYSILFNKVWIYFKKLRTKKRAVDVMDVAVSTKKTFSNYDITLAARLIEKMYESSKSIGAKFILLDVPAIRKSDMEVSSIGNKLYPLIKDKNDFFQSIDILMPFQGLGIIHQPHGLRHITKFSHTVLGVGIGEYIVGDMQSSGTQ